MDPKYLHSMHGVIGNIKYMYIAELPTGNNSGLVVKIYAPDTTPYDQDLAAVSVPSQQCRSSISESTRGSLSSCGSSQSSSSEWSISAFWPMGECPTRYCSDDGDCHENCGLGFRCGLKSALANAATAIMFGAREVLSQTGASICSEVS